MNIELDLTEVLNCFNSLVNDADAIVSNEINKTAYKIERTAKQRCPVDTGRLKGSITTNTGHLEAEVGTNVEYAPFVEFGTIHQRPQPFMIPSFEQHTNGLEDVIMERLLND